jgi:hypothetical protein
MLPLGPFNAGSWATSFNIATHPENVNHLHELNSLNWCGQVGYDRLIYREDSLEGCSEIFERNGSPGLRGDTGFG